jgi:ABC-type sugar transport system ATPase subunit
MNMQVQGLRPGATTRPPPEVVVAGLDKRYENAARATFTDLSVTCPAGRITIIVGPSGCGKTTLLRCICGLESTTGGSIFFGERDVTAVAAEKRGVAMVFQNYALYPDKTVAENIAFPLRMAKVPADERERRIEAAARLVRIEDYLDRKPAQLSGGQRQRVGIARAIVRGPQVLLMDEPLSNLDTKLRAEMRAELATLQRQVGATTVYVTHDQTEALTLADHLIVMRDGVVEQEGPPAAVFQTPSSAFVADFMGRMNLLPGTISGNRLMLDGGGEILLPARLPVASGEGAIIGFRAEELRLGARSHDGLGLAARVVRVELLGTEILVHLMAGSHDMRARLPAATPIGETVMLTADREHIHYFTADGRRIRGQRA